MRPAVFLDRDDTLIVNRDLTLRPGERAGDLADPDRVRLLDGALDGCRWLKRAGFALVIFSNQGVVARGGRRLWMWMRPTIASAIFCATSRVGR